MTEFTPVSATIGGMLIGLSAVLLFRLNGRIAGISGIAAGLVSPKPGGRAWNLLFLLGLLMGPFLYAVFAGKLPDVDFSASYLTIIVAGLLVGFGAKMGSGCTSGHGICGLSRLSPRSIVAVLVFMLSGILTTSMVRVFFLA